MTTPDPTTYIRTILQPLLDDEPQTLTIKEQEPGKDGFQPILFKFPTDTEHTGTRYLYNCLRQAAPMARALTEILNICRTNQPTTTDIEAIIINNLEPYLNIDALLPDRKEIPEDLKAAFDKLNLGPLSADAESKIMSWNQHPE